MPLDDKYLFLLPQLRHDPISPARQYPKGSAMGVFDDITFRKNRGTTPVSFHHHHPKKAAHFQALPAFLHRYLFPSEDAPIGLCSSSATSLQRGYQIQTVSPLVPSAVHFNSETVQRQKPCALRLRVHPQRSTSKGVAPEISDQRVHHDPCGCI